MTNLPDDLGPRLRKSLDHGTPPELSPELVTGASGHTPPRLSNPRARLQVAGGGIAVVAAVAAIALAVGPGLSRPPLFTAASSSAASAASGGASSANVPAANSLMRIWGEYHYHAGPGLSTAGGKGYVYQLTRSGSGAKRIGTLDAIFGLSGQATVADNTDATSPLWTTGSTDGTSASLGLSWSGAGDWWFSDPAAYPSNGCAMTDGSAGSGGAATNSSGDIPPASPDPVVPPACVAQPTGPDKAPKGADARAQAQKLFARTGFTVAASDIQLSSDSSQTTATAYLTIGGVKTALDWGVTWSSTGTISSAYGHSVAVVDRGSYDTISAADAVQRLTDSRWSGSAGPKYQGGVRAYSAVGGASGSANSDTVASPPVPAPSDTPTGTPAEQPTAVPTEQPTATPTDEPTAEPTPTIAPTPEPVPTGPPVIDVTIKKAEPTLLLMWDSNNNAWLVPGYAMQIEGGWWSSVVSLVPGVIELPPVPSIEPDDVAPAVP